MLTAAQCQVVAFSSENGPLCDPCARKAFGELHVDRAIEGLNDRGIIEYVLGSDYADYELTSYIEYQEQDHGASEEDKNADDEWGYTFADGTFISQEDAYAAASVDCADCGAELG